MLERLLLQLMCYDLGGTSVLKNLGGAEGLELAPWMLAMLPSATR